MTTTKEALEHIIAIPNREYGSDWDEIEEAREIARQALVSLEGDAVERVAETIWRAELRRATGRERNVPWSEVSEVDQERFRYIARAVLATSLVPDEATIRADEREKCAAQFQGKDIWTGEAIAAAIRSGGGE